VATFLSGDELLVLIQGTVKATHGAVSASKREIARARIVRRRAKQACRLAKEIVERMRAERRQTRT
jgi:hypothetical protein